MGFNGEMPFTVKQRNQNQTKWQWELKHGLHKEQ